MNKHTFHIPVMGTSYTIDSPIKVAHLGISSVISLVDDDLIERMRKVYSQKLGLTYKTIKEKEYDSRAKRITAYLDLVHDIVETKCEEVKKSFKSNSESAIKELKEKFPLKYQFLDYSKGSIDVNIMTKIDKENYSNKIKLPSIFNDAHASLRGFAKSKLSSSLILSAGMNPRLFSYFEEFKDFYPNKKGELKKKIVVKVSDFRSALIQGKMLAKKGLWVSEFRIESGLNCGGHAFATNGLLMGPILEEFKNKKNELIDELKSLYCKGLDSKGYSNDFNFPIIITAQGGVGTSEEHDFLLKEYELDSVGWGSPFLLVDEAVTIDEVTINKLAEAKEKDLYLSNASPLGVPFNNLKMSSKQKESKISFLDNRPGSPCTKKLLISNSEYGDELICTASRKYQQNKISEIDDPLITASILEKECLCQGLSKSAFVKYDENEKKDGVGVSVCPGPNMAYFTEKVSLNKMINHIYGKDNVISSKTIRPNMFLKELSLYMKDLNQKYNEAKSLKISNLNKIKTYKDNLLKGIIYYENLSERKSINFLNTDVLKQLSKYKIQLETIIL